LIESVEKGEGSLRSERKGIRRYPSQLQDFEKAGGGIGSGKG